VNLALPLAALPLAALPLEAATAQPFSAAEPAAALPDGAGALPLFGAALEAIILAAGQEAAPAAATEGLAVVEADTADSGSDTPLPGMTPPLLSAMLGLPMPVALPDSGAPDNQKADKIADAGAAAPATAMPGAAILATPTAPIIAAMAADTPAPTAAQPRAPAPAPSLGQKMPSLDKAAATTPTIDENPDSPVQAAGRQTPPPAAGEIADSAEQRSPSLAAPAPVLGADLTAPQPASAGTASSPSAATTVKLPAGTPEQWRQPLLEALGERLQVQIANRSEQAVIRLDPPMMGSVELVIRHQAGTLQIQLSASHGEVLRQLHSIGDSLRQDLAQGPYADVSVHVSSHGRDGDGRQRPRQDDAEPAAPGRALAEAEDGLAGTRFALTSDHP